MVEFRKQKDITLSAKCVLK